MIRSTRCVRFATFVGLIVWTIANAATASDDPPSPSEIVDAFNTAIDRGDATAAASLLARDVTIFEMGLVDRSRRDYEGMHLALDIEFARTTTRTLISRRQGGDGELHWIVSLYRDEGTHESKPVLHSTAETALLKRVAGNWRIAHLHWSTADALSAATN